MPNATVRANAPTLPIDRRAALGSLAAGAILAAPKLAAISPHLPSLAPAFAAGVSEAEQDDADVFAAVARVTAARAKEEAARSRLAALEASKLPAGNCGSYRGNQHGEVTDKMSATFTAAVDAAEEAFGDAASATSEAALGLLDLRPRSAAGLRAIFAALNDMGIFEPGDPSAAILRLVLQFLTQTAGA